MVMRKIKLNRGKLANLPQLELGEPAVATDDGSLHIGTEQGNVKLAKDADVQAVSQQLADTDAKKADKTITAGLQDQLNGLVLQAGASEPTNAEIVQARGSYSVLNERISIGEYNAVKNQKEILGDVKGTLRPGFYSSSSGAYTNSVTDWFNFYIYNGSSKKFTLSYPQPISLRVVEFAADKTFVKSQLISNGDFTVSDNTAEFSVTVALTSANPPSAPITALPSVNDLYDITIREHGRGVSSEINEIRTTVENEVLETKVPTGEKVRTLLSVPLVTGFYSSATGAFSPNVTNWLSLDVSNVSPEIREFILEHSETGSVRLLLYNQSGYDTHRVINTNEIFTLPESTVRFTVNLALTGADPATSLTKFSNSDFKLYRFEPEYITRSLSERVSVLEQSGEVVADRPLKILSIGNSFSMDAHKGLHDIAESAGVPMILGNLYVGGADLETHWNNVNNNLSPYQYQKYVPGQAARTDTAGASVYFALNNENWDIITFQQSSAYSGVYDRYQPYLNNLIQYVNTYKTNPDAKFAVFMTWAYASNVTRTAFTNYYGGDQMTMYNAIVDANLQAMNETGIDILIPGGTAIQNGRSSDYLMTIDNELTSDGEHLGEMGDYIAGMSFFETLAAPQYSKNIFTDVDFIPNGSTKFLTYLAKVAAKNAAVNPMRVTNLQ